MAQIFPSSLKEYDFKEAGEELVFHLLRNLPDQCFVWYEVVLGMRARKPDFMILDPQRGLWILEVKDWGRETILAVSEREVRLKSTNNTVQRQKNPSRKCRVYIEEAEEKLSLDPNLVDGRDRLVFPIQYFTVFPNLSRRDFDDLRIAQHIDPEHVIFQESLKHPKVFLETFLSSLPLLAEPLSTERVSAIRKHLRDEVTIATPAGINGLMPGVLPFGEVQVEDVLAPDVFAIDPEQERIAKDLGDGPRLLRGIAGTGKTLIMLLKAKLVASNAEFQGAPARILILCWNISLANYMRQAFKFINIPLEQPITILHFMAFVRDLANRHPEVGRFPLASDAEFEPKVSEILAKIRIQPAERYEYIFVDEAQDFRDEWIKFLFHTMLAGDDPKSKNLMLAADDAQRVYKSRDFSWESLGIPMRGDRSMILRKIYRNSARVWGFAAFLLKDIATYYDKNPNLRFSIKSSTDPRLVKCEDENDQIQTCIDLIRDIHDSGYAYRNFLLIYPGKFTQTGFPLVDKLVRRCEKERIPVDWITEDNASKGNFHWSADTVKISTAPSAKGMDAPVVIVLSAESFGDKNFQDYDHTKLLYVALTRAREVLVVLHSQETGLVPELYRCLDLYNRSRDRLLALEKMADG